MSSCFVTQIDLKWASKLRSDLENQGFQLSTPPYTLFSAQKRGISCTLYTSGKLTVQGKEKESFIAFYLEPEILGNLSYTHPQLTIDLLPHIGADEAGKGDFFGPLCIAAVFANEKQILELQQLGVRDSKRLNDSLFPSLAKKIKALCAHETVALFPETYNRLYEQFQNLNHLLAWAHTQAIFNLIEKTGCTRILLDQFSKAPLVEKNLKKKGLLTDFAQRPRAEEDPVVAAASILARTTFPFLSLPKGASVPVIEQGKLLVQRFGKEILHKVAKLHFKTKDAILAPKIE
jgi:ribonuclease HIII